MTHICEKMSEKKKIFSLDNGYWCPLRIGENGNVCITAIYCLLKHPLT